MIQSLSRAMDILLLLCRDKKEYTLQELAERSQLPPSTVHRILQTFCSRTFVVLNKQTHLYSLGPALISLGMAATRNIDLRDASKQVLEELSRITGEDAMLMVVAGFKGLIIEKVEGPRCIKVIEKFGYDFDLHCGGNHRTLLAFQDSEFIEDYIRNGLTKYTEMTVTDAQKLREELAGIRKKGFGISYGEYMEGTLGIGSPVFDNDGKIVASIGIISPAVNSSEEQIHFWIQEIKKHAAILSAKLGYMNQYAFLAAK